MNKTEHGAPPLLEVEALRVQFKVSRRGTWRPAVVKAVDGIDLHVQPGETLGLVGESGCGKSTTGRALMKLVPIHSGTVHLDGQDVAAAGSKATRLLRKRAQMVFQDPYGSLNQRMRIADIIREPLDIHRLGDTASRQRRVTELLDLVGLPADAGSRYPHEFSGGQRQRIGIARALAVEPSLIICDEPVAALDVSVQAQILELLKEVQTRTGVAYLFISHDLNVVRHLSDRTAVMYLGKIVEQGPSAAVFGHPRHPYTQALTAAIPVADPEAVADTRMVEGEIPSPTDPPSGCRFRTRCPFARERCADEEPQLESTGDGASVACHFWRELAMPTAV